jgi:biopolymer transport protein ExbB
MEPTVQVDNPYGIEALWQQGDLVARGTLLLLLIMSAVSWYIIFTKVWDQRRLRQGAKVEE